MLREGTRSVGSARCTHGRQRWTPHVLLPRLPDDLDSARYARWSRSPCVGDDRTVLHARLLRLSYTLLTMLLDVCSRWALRAMLDHPLATLGQLLNVRYPRLMPLLSDPRRVLHLRMPGLLRMLLLLLLYDGFVRYALHMLHHHLTRLLPRCRDHTDVLSRMPLRLHAWSITLCALELAGESRLHTRRGTVEEN